WVTRMVDGLPGVRTTAPSDFNFEAEMGSSFPNPNTANQVYIDDMEGVRDAVSLSMGDPVHWRHSSVPSRKDSLTGLVTSLLDDSTTIRNAELHWFSPYSVVKEHDLKPGLLDAQGGNNAHQVLALSVPRRPASAPPDVALWEGLTYVLDQSGLDLSK